MRAPPSLSPWGLSVLVYALAILTSIANAPYKSAQQAIMPTLAATPNELTATNAVSSTVESLAFFLGLRSPVCSWR